jgi:hypothetical protein
MYIQKLIENLEVLSAISSNDASFSGDVMAYFFAGKSALLNIISAINGRSIYPVEDPTVRSILEVGSGYGRVTR